MPFRRVERSKVLAEFVYAVMDRNVAVRQQGLKAELGQFCETARLCER